MKFLWKHFHEGKEAVSHLNKILWVAYRRKGSGLSQALFFPFSIKCRCYIRWVACNVGDSRRSVRLYSLTYWNLSNCPAKFGQRNFVPSYSTSSSRSLIQCHWYSSPSLASLLYHVWYSNSFFERSWKHWNTMKILCFRWNLPECSSIFNLQLFYKTAKRFFFN